MISVNRINLRHSITFNSIARFWLFAVLLFFPFQRRFLGIFVSWDNEILAYISYVDEITIAVFLVCSIREFWKRKGSFDQTLLVLLLSIIILCFSGIVSGLINNNSLLVTFLRSEEHTSELQSHSFISYAVFCLKKKNKTN